MARASDSFEALPGALPGESFRGVARVECNPGARVIEAGRCHRWDCILHLPGERALERVYDYVELLGGRATLKREWFKVFLHPAKRVCREYELVYEDGESGKALECE